MASEPVLDISRVLTRIASERITIPGPPTIYRAMLDHPDLQRYGTSPLRLALTGATSVPVELILRMCRE